MGWRPGLYCKAGSLWRLEEAGVSLSALGPGLTPAAYASHDLGTGFVLLGPSFPLGQIRGWSK